MNEEQYAQWEVDAARALSGRYTEAEIAIVIAWFYSIKGVDECELIGDEAVKAMLEFVRAKNNFDMYNSLMARLFIYAPLILAQHKRQA